MRTMIVVVSLSLLVLPGCWPEKIGSSTGPQPSGGLSVPAGAYDIPPVLAVKEYLAATTLDGQQYSLSEPPFCEILPKKAPRPGEVCMTIRTMFQESRADIELLTATGTIWNLVDEPRGAKWAVTSATLAGSQ